MEASNIIQLIPERKQLQQMMRDTDPHPYRLADMLLPASWVFLTGPLSTGYQLVIENMSDVQDAVISVYTESQGWLYDHKKVRKGNKRVLTNLNMGQHAIYVANLTETLKRQPAVKFSLVIPARLYR